jgi:hypothetical protein
MIVTSDELLSRLAKAQRVWRVYIYIYIYIYIHTHTHTHIYEGRLISNAHSEISRKRNHVFKQTKVGSKVQYFSYKLT